jgi:hypothetical protein
MRLWELSQKKEKKSCFLDLQRVLLSRLLMRLCLNQKLVTLLFHACMIDIMMRF